MLRLINMAAGVSLPTVPNDPRGFWIGAVGIRNDGTIVTSRNGAVEFQSSVQNHQLMPHSHAEGRCLRKLGKHGTIYVARVSKQDHSLKLAKPCGMCRTLLRSAKVEQVYYSIDNHSYGLWLPHDDITKIFHD